MPIRDELSVEREARRQRRGWGGWGQGVHKAERPGQRKGSAGIVRRREGGGVETGAVALVGMVAARPLPLSETIYSITAPRPPRPVVPSTLLPGYGLSSRELVLNNPRSPPLVPPSAPSPFFRFTSCRA